MENHASTARKTKYGAHRNNKSSKKSSVSKPTKRTQLNLPRSASEVSSNWKALSAVLATEKKRKDNKRKGVESKFFKSKKRRPNNHQISNEKYSKNESTANNEIWFDDVDPEDIEKVTGKKFEFSDHGEHRSTQTSTNSTLVQNVDDKGDPAGQAPRSTKCVAMDCEFVGIGKNGEEHMLARVSVVNSDGDVLYDQFVAPQEKVVDYRTDVSGVRPSDLKNAPNFVKVQKEVANLIKNKTLVGHAIATDLKVLFLDHPRKRIRDTAKYKPFQERMRTKYPSLKKLAREVLSLSIQTGEHSSVEDARAAMQLYREHRKEWEKSIKDKFRKNRSKPETKAS